MAGKAGENDRGQMIQKCWSYLRGLDLILILWGALESFYAGRVSQNLNFKAYSACY